MVCLQEIHAVGDEMNANSVSKEGIALAAEDFRSCRLEATLRVGKDSEGYHWSYHRGWHDPDCRTLFAVFEYNEPSTDHKGYEVQFSDLRHGANVCDLCNLFASTTIAVLGTTISSEDVVVHIRSMDLMPGVRNPFWDLESFYVSIPHPGTNRSDANLLRGITRYQLLGLINELPYPWPIEAYNKDLLHSYVDVTTRCGLAKKIYLRKLSFDNPLSIPTLHLARYVPTLADLEKCIPMIRHWLSFCVANHDVCKNLEMSAKNNGIPSRLIDIGDSTNSRIRVISGALRDIQYTALSYKWGQGLTCKLEKASLLAFSSHIAWSALPRTYQEAIALTWALGLRYIWIDSLCIIQDDENDFQLESTKMADIYKFARLVISADCASDTQAGFLNRENASKLLPCRNRPVDLTVEHHSLGALKLRAWQEDAEDFTVCESFKYDEPVEFRGITESQGQRQQHGFELYSDEPISSRAWCFQEYLSATRLIHFTSKEMIWECNEAHFCECGYQLFTADTVSMTGNMGNETQKDSSPTISPVPAVSVAADRHVTFAWNKKVDFHVQASETKTRQQFAVFWGSVIQEYSGRQLTYPMDRLPAISGIARYLEHGDFGGYFAGHWQATLPETLAWYIDQSDLPRSTVPKTTMAPSWSWATTENQVWFEYNHNRCHATLIKVTSCVVGNNPYGRVSAGTINLLAPVVNGELICERLVLEWTEEERYSVSWYPDVGKHEEKIRPVLCVIISGDNNWCRGVVVVPSTSSRDCFERIGYAQMQSAWYDTRGTRSVDSGWYETRGARRREITIV
ncbi:hypothetical protein PV11_10188 [Exophiala sideris]|uniref:Heterokaryon incompatibility domain-containing protein n=1 Tax=Exophiala sideris TaxID=1016849 RepID=A0A0D1YUE1_9EURO|nr:hypothetical protein PV11_10188 [Exophiala sideris]